MTSVDDFRAQFTTTIDMLSTGLPAGSYVFVASIPNIYRLWQVLHGNYLAQIVWATAGICQSMLSIWNTEADRQAVLAREQAFNQILGDVCAAYANCRFDELALFDYDFSPSRVSTLDYFHPSLSGQASLASVTWQKSWWGTP
jgi:hypothetical protein